MIDSELVVLLEEFAIPLVMYTVYSTAIELKQDIKKWREEQRARRSIIVVGWIILAIQSLCLLWNFLIWLVLII